MTDRELLEQALEALELRCGTNAHERDELIPALRERLEQPERGWIGLTDDEVKEIAATPAAIVGSYVHTVGRAIEAKLKGKNT